VLHKPPDESENYNATQNSASTAAAEEATTTFGIGLPPLSRRKQQRHANPSVYGSSLDKRKKQLTCVKNGVYGLLPRHLTAARREEKATISALLLLPVVERQCLLSKKAVNAGFDASCCSSSRRGSGRRRWGLRDVLAF
jgi:hypothetical protein